MSKKQVKAQLKAINDLLKKQNKKFSIEIRGNFLYMKKKGEQKILMREAVPHYME